MTPIIHIRSYSTDQYYLDKVFYSNFYRLKKQEQKDQIIFDIGAHCGYFELAAMAAGYSKVYALEPYQENYRMLLKNTEVFFPNIINFQFGMSDKEEFSYLKSPELNENKFLDYGVLQSGTSEDGLVCKFSTLTSLVNDLVKEDKVDLLKISIGNQVDFTSGNESCFSKIENICFETPYNKEFISFIKSKLTQLGFKDSLVVELKEKTQAFGFLCFFSKDNLDNVFEIKDLRDKNYEN